MDTPADQLVHQIHHLPGGCHPGTVDRLLGMHHIRARIEGHGISFTYKGNLRPLFGSSYAGLASRIACGTVDGALNALSSRHVENILYGVITRFEHIIDQAKLLCAALVLCGGVLIRFSPELNAFAVGEDNARHIGINVKRVKLIILITESVLIGVCVSISGTVSFVGLVMPHIARMLVGPNHKRLLPASLFSGAIFLLLADLTARTLLSPIELPIGVVTSIVGAVAFVIIFYKTRKAR